MMIDTRQIPSSTGVQPGGRLRRSLRKLASGPASKITLALGIAAFLGACEIAPVVSKTPDPTAPIARSAESQRLVNYYAGLEQRMRAQGQLRTDGGGPDVPFNARTLVANFEKVALYSEYVEVNGRFIAKSVPSPLRRWQVPIRVGINFGDLVSPEQRAKDTANVTAFSKRLARLTGLDIQVTDQRPNFNIMFLNRDEQRSSGPRVRALIPGISPTVVREVADSPRYQYCVAYAFPKSALIIIKSELPDLMRLSCIHEEMSQALGLTNDSPDARPSIFNDDEEFALLTTHDEFLLRMLYDPRLKPGMLPENARSTLMVVANDLLAGGS